MLSKSRTPLLWILLILIALIPAGLNAFEQTKKLLVEKDSLYHHIQILEETKENTTIRCMKFTGKTPTNQSCIDLSDPNRQVLEYSEMAFSGLLFSPQPRSVLVIGLGGGIIPSIYNRISPLTKVDVVEIDEDVLGFAKKYFGFKPSEKTRVIIRDGRRFAKRSEKRYDFIVLDAFNGDQIPFHLMTAEFFEMLKKTALTEDGILVSNVFFNSRLFGYQLATYRECFAGVYPFVGQRSGNVIVVATKKRFTPSPAKLIETGRKLQEENRYPFFDLEKVAAMYKPDLAPDPEAKVLRDDYAPVNYLFKKKP